MSNNIAKGRDFQCVARTIAFNFVLHNACVMRLFNHDSRKMEMMELRCNCFEWLRGFTILSLWNMIISAPPHLSFTEMQVHVNWQCYKVMEDFYCVTKAFIICFA